MKKIYVIAILLFVQKNFAMEQIQQPQAAGWFGSIGQMFHAVNLKQNGVFVLNPANGDTRAQVSTWLAYHPVNETDNNGNTLLHITAQMNNITVTEFLLEQGANINARNSNNETPLHLATQGQFKLIVDILLGHNAQHNLANSAGEFPLTIALRLRNLNIASSLVDHHASLGINDTQGNNPLHIAAQAQQGHLFLQKINSLPDGSLNAHNNEGDTPLHIALRSYNTEVINLLMNLNPEIDHVNNNGETIFHAAAQSQHDHVLGILLSHEKAHKILAKKINGTLFINCCTNVQNHAPQQTGAGQEQIIDTEGSDTALHIAARHGLRETITILKPYVDLSIVNQANLTAYQVALTHNHAAILPLLQLPSLWSKSWDCGKKYAPIALDIVKAARSIPGIAKQVNDIEEKLKSKLPSQLKEVDIIQAAELIGRYSSQCVIV